VALCFVLILDITIILLNLMVLSYHLLFLLQVKAADNRVIQDQLNEKVRYALELTLFLLR
jgi:hypothetical protein